MSQEHRRIEDEIGPLVGGAERGAERGAGYMAPQPSLLSSASAALGGAALQRKLLQRVQRKESLGAGKETFDSMWAAHPHNYQDDESQNTASADLLKEQGLPDWLGNTCAVRLSTMLNRTGHEITPQKTKAAGLSRAPMFSKATKQYYIVAASEMWTYLAKNFRKADIEFPATGIYKDADAFTAAYDKDIKPIVSARKGIVAFETIFGYGGTGHVDLFNGEGLSDAPNWYPCKRLHLWYIDVP